MKRKKPIREPSLDEIKKDRSKEFLRTAERLTRYIETLALTDEQAKKLALLWSNHIRVAEEDAMCRGVELGTAHTLSELQKQLR